jgi:hypothetical protein
MHKTPTGMAYVDVVTKSSRRAVPIAMALALTLAACGDSSDPLAEPISADAPAAAVAEAAVEGRHHMSPDAAERWAASAAAANRYAGMASDAAERWPLPSSVTARAHRTAPQQPSSGSHSRGAPR